jgi:predicted nucleotidyltransferase
MTIIHGCATFPFRIDEVRPHLHPTASDARIGRDFAARIALAGEGRVRCVAMIGSRALGCSTPLSDLDLVVLEEPAARDSDWDGKRADEEKARLERKLGPPPMPTDITVRSTQQYMDAREVFGGVEWLIDSEGVVLFASPLTRNVVPRRSKERVRNALIVAWLEAALRSLAKARTAHITLDDPRIMVAHVVGKTMSFRAPSAPVRTPEYYWHRSTQQALAAACVFHQVVAAKHDNMHAVAVKLSGHSDILHDRFSKCASAPACSSAAYSAVLDVITWVRAQGAMGGVLETFSRRLRELKDQDSGSERAPGESEQKATVRTGSHLSNNPVA